MCFVVWPQLAAPDTPHCSISLCDHRGQPSLCPVLRLCSPRPLPRDLTSIFQVTAQHWTSSALHTRNPSPGPTSLYHSALFYWFIDLCVCFAWHPLPPEIMSSVCFFTFCLMFHSEVSPRGARLALSWAPLSSQAQICHLQTPMDAHSEEVSEPEGQGTVACIEMLPLSASSAKLENSFA